MAYDYDYFKAEVLALTSIDLNCYKEKQMKRRIDALIAKHMMGDYGRYVQAMRADRAIFDEFVSYITINVSEFYRDPKQWMLMEREVIPGLIRRFGQRLKVWSAACSTGDEPYSLVMALSRHIPLADIRILATDMDRQIIEQAKTGLYSAKSIAAVPADFKQMYFTPTGSSFQVSEPVRTKVEFRVHNLLKDIYPAGCHMIVCRNVLIYFTEEAKDKVFRKYFEALAPGGVLFLGSSEQIVNYREIGYVRQNAFFYQKPV